MTCAVSMTTTATSAAAIAAARQAGPVEHDDDAGEHEREPDPGPCRGSGHPSHDAAHDDGVAVVAELDAEALHDLRPIRRGAHARRVRGRAPVRPVVVPPCDGSVADASPDGSRVASRRVREPVFHR